MIVDLSAPPDRASAPDERPDGDQPGVSDRVARWLPLLLAVACFVAMGTLVLSQAEKMVEPDPYAYRASIVALGAGDLTLTQSQHDQLTQQLEQTSLGGGISQWHQNANGTWVSEKNPGYPFLVVGFDQVGAMRLAPLFYGALACIGLWFGARRWLGRWGGTFAVGAYCSAAVVLVMAWRSFMPTFTDASLVACGIGLLVWSALSIDRSHRARVIVGAAAFFALGLAVFVRYTNVAVLAVAALFALLVCVRTRWKLGRPPLVWWALAALPPVIGSLVYNAVVFDGPFSTGYSSTSVKFTLDSIPENLRIMPSHLWRAMPVFVVGLAAVIGLIGVQIWNLARHRSGAALSEPADDQVPRLVTDRWIGLFLIAAWAAIWGVYAAYEWTTNSVGGGPVGGAGGASFFGDGSFLHPNYAIVRFYVPALGAIALLAAWLIVRLPRVLGVAVLIGLFIAGGAGFIATADASTSGLGGGAVPGSTFPGGGPGAGAQLRGGSGGQAPDLSQCTNLPPPGSGGAGGPGAPGSQNGSNGQGRPPAGLTLDDNGCPVLPSTTTTTSP